MPVHLLPTRSGPNARAGLADEPLNGIPAKCAAMSAREIATSALVPKRSLRLAWRFTSTTMVMNRNSIQNAVPSPAAGTVAGEATADWLLAIRSATAPRTGGRQRHRIRGRDGEDSG